MGAVPKPPEKHDRPSPGKDVAPQPAKTKGAPKGKGRGKNGAEERQGPQNIIGPRVNLALPFAKIEVQEPSADLVELARVLSDLVTALAGWVPEESLADIRSRAEALSARLST